MKTLVNIIVIFSVGYAAYLLMPYFHGWFGGVFMVSRNATTYWGWFDWLTVLDWIPRLLMGFVTGLCAAVLCRGDNPHLWALACGILLMATAYLTTGGGWAVEPPPVQKAFRSLWPVMYPIGTFLGGLFLVAVRSIVENRADR
jgi:hypothetical protein